MSEQDGRAILAELFRHNDWANARLLELCQGLSDEALEHRIQGIYGSVRETLQHLVAAQAYFAFLLTGEQPEPPLRSRDPFPGFDVLKGRAEASGRVLQEVAARLTTDQSWRDVEEGQEWEMRSFVVLVQAINHATEHREQVKVTLSQAGVEVPSLDGWTYGEQAGHIRQIGPARRT